MSGRSMARINTGIVKIVLANRDDEIVDAHVVFAAGKHGLSVVYPIGWRCHLVEVRTRTGLRAVIICHPLEPSGLGHWKLEGISRGKEGWASLNPRGHRRFHRPSVCLPLSK